LEFWLIGLESIPDLTPLLKPTTLGDVATYFFASAGGLLLGGELGKIPVLIDMQSVLTFLCRFCWWCGEWNPEYLC
jgi:hypothetical protein